MKLAHPEDVDLINTAFEDALSHVKPYNLEHRIIRLSDGETRNIHASAQVFSDENGENAYMIGIAQDITERKQVEAKLQQSEHQARLILDTLTEGVALNEMVFDANGNMIDYKILEVNPSYYKIADFNPDSAVIGSLATELYGMREEDIKAFYREHKTKKTIAHAEFVSPITKKTFAIETSPFENNTFITTFQDITERKKAEEKIKNAELLLRSSLEGLKDTVFFSIDKNYHYLFFNMAHKDAMKSGYNKDITIGMNMLDCIASDDDRQAAKENYDRALAGETHSNIREFGSEVVSYFESYFNPILNDNDEVIGATALARDITERKHIEEALRASEDRLQLINNATLDQIYSYDLDNRFTSANRQLCEMLNLSAEEIIGKSYWELGFPETQCREWDEMHQRVYKAGSHTEIVSTTMPDGIMHYFEVNLSVIRDYDGAIVGIAGVNRDITERKQAEQERRSLEAQLHQAQKLEAIGTMVGGISHEFNNVLQSMFLHAGLVQDELPEDEELRSSFQHILDDGNRARDLIKQVLTFSRKAKVEMKPQPLHEMVMEVLVLERASLPANIHIQQDIDLNCGLVLCDQTQIHQIMINLCNNAQHAMEENGGTLTVSLKPTNAFMRNNDLEAKAVELIVADTGHGIEAADLDRIFDPFFTTKQIGAGTGLGLSVIHGIVEMMEGQTSVTSQIGKGTTFRILFPVSDAIEEVEPSTSLAEPNVMSRSILLVDDEDNIREAIKNILARKGFYVDSATDGQQALELFLANPGKYDLIVTDQSMPKMSGAELTKAIRTTDSEIPIILSTGQLGIQDKQEFKEIGITTFIQKPWTARELMDRIKEFDHN